MTKEEYLKKLRRKLAPLPKEEKAQRISFYSEMIDDRMEEGLSEEEAVAEIAAKDDPHEALLERQPKRLTPWQIVLLVLGAPLWIPLLAAAAAVALSVYIIIWVVLICLWAADAACALGAVAGVICGIILIPEGVAKGLAAVAVGCVLGGLAIFLFFGCLYATKGVLSGTKRLFRKKEEQK